MDNYDKHADVLNTLVYTLNSGVKGSIELSKSQLEEWEECYKTNKKFVIESGKYVFGLNPNLVADFKCLREQSIETSSINIIQTHIEETQDELEEDPVISFKIICKCGATYLTPSRKSRKKSNCKYCQSPVFVDYSSGIIETHYGNGLLMTNTKYIDKNAAQPEGYDDLKRTYSGSRRETIHV